MKRSGRETAVLRVMARRARDVAWWMEKEKLWVKATRGSQAAKRRQKSSRERRKISDLWGRGTLHTS